MGNTPHLFLSEVLQNSIYLQTLGTIRRAVLDREGCPGLGNDFEGSGLSGTVPVYTVIPMQLLVVPFTIKDFLVRTTNFMITHILE